MNWNTSARRRLAGHGRGSGVKKRRWQRFNQLQNGICVPPFRTNILELESVHTVKKIDALTEPPKHDLQIGDSSIPVQHISIDMHMLKAADRNRCEDEATSSNCTATLQGVFRAIGRPRLNNNNPWDSLELSPTERDDLGSRKKNLMIRDFGSSNFDIAVDRSAHPSSSLMDDEGSDDSPASVISNEIQYFDSDSRFSTHSMEPWNDHNQDLQQHTYDPYYSSDSPKSKSRISFWDSPEKSKRPHGDSLQLDVCNNSYDYDPITPSFVLIPPPPEVVQSLTSSIADIERNQEDSLELTAFV